MPNMDLWLTEKGSYTQKVSWQGYDPPASTVSVTYRSIYANRSSGNTPNYPWAAATGNLPENRFGFNKEVVTAGFGYRRRVSGYYKDEESGVFSGYGTGNVLKPSGLEIENAYQGILAKARNKVKDQHIDLGVVYGERQQTWNLIRDSAIRFRTAYSQLRKGNIVAAAKLLGVTASNPTAFKKAFRKNRRKAVSDAFLELQYGWMPLVSDVYGAVQEIQTKRSQKKFIRVASGTQLFRSQVLYPAEGWTETYETRMDLKVILKYEMSNEAILQASALGITNPAGWVWELTPFSFVVDWFLRIGSFISQFDATLGWRFRKGCYTSFLQGSVRMRSVWHGPKREFNAWDEDIEGKRELITNTRDGFITEPVAILPSFKNPISALHAAEAIALLQSTKR